MSGLTIDELIGALQIQKKTLGGSSPVVIQCRLSGIGSRGVVEYRQISHLVPLEPDKKKVQGLNVVADQFSPYRRFVDGKEVLI